MKILPSGAIEVDAPTVQTPRKSTGRVLTNWLKAYQEYTEENEAPPLFHLWVGLSTLAGAAQRKVHIPLQGFYIHTNMYIILVAPPGRARKSTALRMGKSLLRDVPGVHFTTSATTPAALIDQLAAIPSKEHQSLSTYASELGTFLGSDMKGMVDLLTDIYDCDPDWDKQTVSRSKQKINAPWLNILAATTPRWLGDNMTSTAVEGGFFARSLFVFANIRRLISPFPRVTDKMRLQQRKLINDLCHIALMEGEFQMEPEADAFYDSWYRDESRFKDAEDIRLSGYYDRKHVHVLKLAMMLALAERDDMILRKVHLEIAMDILEEIEPGMKSAFSSVGKNPLATDTEAILSHLRAAPGEVDYAELLSAHFHLGGKKVVDEMLDHLQAMQKISWRFDHQRGTKYFKARYNGRP